MSSVLNLTYSGASIPEDPYWIRLEQVGVASDVATISSAAAVLDALYDTDACNDSTATAGDDGATENNIFPSMTDVEQVAALVHAAAEEVGIETAICDQEADGSVEVEIKAFTSHPFDAHRWRITGGSLVSEIQVVVDISLSISVEKGSSVVLDYPVVSGFSASWGATDGPTPSIKRIGNSLYWAGTVTGYLRVSYRSVYHLATVKVDGVDGAQGEVQVRCFFHGLVEEMEPELPEPAEYDDALCTSRIHWQPTDEDDKVTCYQSVAVSKKCGCSKEEVDSYTYDQVVPCPDWAPKKCPGALHECMHNLGTVSATEYVPCANDGDDYLADPKYYESVCCGPPSPLLHLPDCREEHRTWKGGAPIENGVAYWRGIYGNDLRIVAVPPPGGICGTWTIRQEILTHNCCDEVADLEWSTSASATVVAASGSATVAVSGGRGPYEWSISGQGFYLEIIGQRKATTSHPSVRVVTDGACGRGAIKVDDGCSETTGFIRSVVGGWVTLPESDWPEPSGLMDYDWTYNDGYAGTFNPVKEVGAYEIRQALSRVWNICNYASSWTSYDEACAASPSPTVAEMIATQEARFDPSVPQYFSPDIFLSAVAKGDWVIYTIYDSDNSNGGWHDCGNVPGVVCLENYTRYATTAPHYQCYDCVDILLATNDIMIRRWDCV